MVNNGLLHCELRPLQCRVNLFANCILSAPHMHCMALELLEDKLVPGNTALDVGSGSGYLTVRIRGTHIVFDSECKP